MVAARCAWPSSSRRPASPRAARAEQIDPRRTGHGRRRDRHRSGPRRAGSADARRGRRRRASDRRARASSTRSTSRPASSRRPAIRRAARRSSRSSTRELRLYPVGRLDIDTTGLILLTNDGELAHRLTHPRFEVDKTYRAVVGARRSASRRCGGCGPGSSSRTARPRRPGSGVSRPTRSSSPSTRVASARSSGCASRSATRSRDSQRVAARAAGTRRPAPGAHRRLSRPRCGSAAALDQQAIARSVVERPRLPATEVREQLGVTSSNRPARHCMPTAAATLWPGRARRASISRGRAERGLNQIPTAPHVTTSHRALFSYMQDRRRLPF